MNRLTKYLWVTALGVGLWSCTSDEPVATEISKFEGDQAAMTIRVYAPSDATRAGADGQTTDYTNGSDDENFVRSLYFYFYDKHGDYVTCYENAKYDPITDKPTGSAYVEEIGTSKIVLTDLLGQNYPSYVIAVLNLNSTTATSVFKQSLPQVRDALRTATPWTSSTSNGVNKITDFIITSATHSGNSEDFYYFATPIAEKNFAVQPEGSKPNGQWPDVAAEPVEIFVERLAAKVEIRFPGFSLTEDGYYKVELPDDYEIDGSKKKLTVRLYGWGVNGQAKKIKYFKSVNITTPFRTQDGWDYNGTNRCYWARTPGYGENKYPSSFEDVENKEGNPASEDKDDAALQETLTYISWNDVKNNSFKSGALTAYVMPHTEDGNQINLAGNQINHPALTEILIAGQIVDDAGNPFTLFQLSESYYTEEGVINYLLNASKGHIWKKTDDNKYKNIEAADVDVKYGYDGTFSIIITNQEATWYQDNEGKVKWDNAAAVAAEINAYLPDKQSFCYNDGMLYYNIPIKHLRPYTAGEQILTGMFGVVRNHWYQVSVNAIKNLGHSVYRPDEHIIPPSDDTRYMIGSSIKILSWRLVKQNAEL